MSSTGSGSCRSISWAPISLIANQRRVQAAVEAVGGPVIELDRDLDRR
jgi:hypothetical protein